MSQTLMALSEPAETKTKEEEEEKGVEPDEDGSAEAAALVAAEDELDDVHDVTVAQQ